MIAAATKGRVRSLEHSKEAAMAFTPAKPAALSLSEALGLARLAADGAERLIANPPFLPSFESAPEVRALSSAGITRPHRSYDPVRLPPGPPPESDGGDATSNRTGLPRLPTLPFQRAVPTTPADRTGACVDGLPVRATFPKCTVGRRPHWFFRGLLRLHSRYGPPDRSTAQGGLCHEASARPVTQPNRSSATGLIDNYPGGTPLLH